MRAFEIHTFHGGKWKINAIFDDRELAVFEAQRMDSSLRYGGVRVVEEVFDEKSLSSAIKTIFRGRKVEQALPATVHEPMANADKSRTAAPRQAPDGRAGGVMTGIAVPIVILLLTLFGSAMVIVGLRYLTDAI